MREILMNAPHYYIYHVNFYGGIIWHHFIKNHQKCQYMLTLHWYVIWAKYWYTSEHCLLGLIVWFMWPWLCIAPDCHYTHWKQTVFYLEDCLTVKKSEPLTGHFTMNANPNNKRDLNFTVSVEFSGELMKCSLQQNYRMR